MSDKDYLIVKSTNIECSVCGSVLQNPFAHCDHNVYARLVKLEQQVAELLNQSTTEKKDE